MLDLHLFRDRTFSASTVSAVLNYIAIFSILLLIPFYLIDGRGYSPSQAGLILTIQPLVMALGAPISGAISDRIGTKVPSFLGMIILSVGLLFMTRLGPQSSVLEIGFTLAIAGLGTGIFISPNSSALMGAAPKSRQGIAAGILATGRSVGMVLGVGLAGAILTSVLARFPPPTGLFQAIHICFFITSGLACLAGVISLVKE
jgi:MFS family permease